MFALWAIKVRWREVGVRGQGRKDMEIPCCYVEMVCGVCTYVHGIHGGGHVWFTTPWTTPSRDYSAFSALRSDPCSNDPVASACSGDWGLHKRYYYAPLLRPLRPHKLSPVRPPRLTSWLRSRNSWPSGYLFFQRSVAPFAFVVTTLQLINRVVRWAHGLAIAKIRKNPSTRAT